MANWSVTLRGLTIGTGTSYEFESPGVAGLGNPPVRAADQQRGHLSGDAGGDDVFEKRVITIPVVVLADTDTACRVLLRALQTAWRPSPINLDLTVSIAGESLTYQGRPRGCDADLEFLGLSLIHI